MTSTTVSGGRPGSPADRGGRAEPRRRLLAGWPQMLRLVLRLDRIRLLVWAAAIGALVFVSASSVEGLYATAESLAGYVALVEGNAAVVVQAGPGFGLDDPTLGSVLMNEVSIWTLILVSLMSILMVTRHTRAEEASDRAEILRATPLGRYAGAVAAMAGVLIANVLVAAVVATGLVISGYDGTGALAFAATLVGTGMVFASVSLVTGQIATSSRVASGLALIVLGVSFILRAVGDVGNGVLSWFSPLGWGQAIRAFAGERWWVLGVQLVATVALVAVAGWLSGRRDFGAGMLPQRSGRPEAGPMLSSTLGLAVRLQRGAWFGWLAGVTVISVFYGVITDEVDQMVTDNPELEAFFAQAGVGSITDSFLATAALMIGLLASGYMVSAVLRLRSEEIAVHADPLLATPTPRRTWASSHLVVAAIGTVILLAVAGSALGLGAAVVTGDWGRVSQMSGAALAVAPAVAVLGALAFALCCAAPRWSLLAWVGVAVAVAVGLLGETLGLSQWVRNLSPLQHVPPLPAAPLAATPLVVLAVVAIVLVGTGLIGLGRRDFGVT